MAAGCGRGLGFGQTASQRQAFALGLKVRESRCRAGAEEGMTMLLDLTSGLAQSCLILPQPASPAVLGRHDSPLEKIARFLAEMAGIGQ